MTPVLARLLEISINNAPIPSDREKVLVVPIYMGAIDRQSQTIDP